MMPSWTRLFQCIAVLAVIGFTLVILSFWHALILVVLIVLALWLLVTGKWQRR